MKISDRIFPQFILEFHDLVKIRKKPGINVGQRVQVFDRHAKPKCIAQAEDIVGPRARQPFPGSLKPYSPFVRCERCCIKTVFPISTQPVPVLFQRAKGFLQGLFERPPEGHCFTD
jgi:hypothetical protein